MKKIIFLLCIMSVFITTNAQTFNSKTSPNTSTVTRGSYGTYQSIGYTAATMCTITTNTVTATTSPLALPHGKIDTGYAQWTIGNNLNRTFDFLVTKTSGTVAGTLLLQGSNDNATWFTLTGVTTYCATCQGASATVGNATTHYMFFLPANAMNFPFMQGRLITSDTSGVATFQANVYTSY